MPTFVLNSKAYGYIKWLVSIVLPASGTAYFSLGQLYGWGNETQVLGTLTIITTFLGVVLGISSKNFNDNPDGEIVVEKDPATGRTVHSLNLNITPDKIPSSDKLTFKVVRDPSIAE